MTLKDLVGVTKESTCDIRVYKRLKFKGITQMVGILTFNPQQPEINNPELFNCEVEKMDIYDNYTFNVILSGVIVE